MHPYRTGHSLSGKKWNLIFHWTFSLEIIFVIMVVYMLYWQRHGIPLIHVAMVFDHRLTLKLHKPYSCIKKIAKKVKGISKCKQPY